ncbi:MAG: WYL domain-containing protein [Bacteroidota bacterium]
MNPRERILRLLLRVLNNPGRYTRKQLAEQLDCTAAQLQSDTRVINTLGEMSLVHDPHTHTYRIEINNQFTALDQFRPLSEEERYLIIQALHRGMGSAKKAALLQSKIEGLYDFQQLGLRQLRHPAIVKINRLEGAKAAQQKVKLVNYRSNSNKIRDRVVEPFLINPELDTLQAYDYIHATTRHFRLSRIERVELLTEAWEMTHRHESLPTDVFRIRDLNQVTVKLRLSIRAYNVLVETYPTATAYIDPDPERADHYIFQGKVNGDYKGIDSFLMGYADQVEVLSPASLRTHLRGLAEGILEKL